LICSKSRDDYNILENFYHLLSTVHATTEIELNFILREKLDIEIQKLNNLFNGQIFRSIDSLEKYYRIKKDFLVQSANKNVIETNSLLFQDIVGKRK
jgi:hypothetical protein